MKFKLLLLSTLCCCSLYSQPAAPNERAKVFYDKFLKIVEDIKKKDAENASNEVVVLKMLADNAKQQLGHIQKRDPEFNIAPLLAMIQPYIDAHQLAVKDNNDRIAALGFHTTDEGCYGLFMANTTSEFRSSGNLEEDLKVHVKQLEAYQKKLENILTNHMQGVEECKDFIRQRVETGRKAAEKSKVSMQTLSDHRAVKYLYREVAGEEAYWGAALKLYPDVPGLAALHTMLREILVADGGFEGWLNKAAARKAEKLKNTFMPKAVQVNAALESEFREAFLAEGWNETVIKINILSRDWNIVRNSLTGVIICRTQTAAIVAKQKAGNCVMYDYTIKQQYTGSGYSGVSSRYAHGVLADEFLCENAAK